MRGQARSEVLLQWFGDSPLLSSFHRKPAGQPARVCQEFRHETSQVWMRNVGLVLWRGSISFHVQSAVPCFKFAQRGALLSCLDLGHEVSTPSAWHFDLGWDWSGLCLTPFYASWISIQPGFRTETLRSGEQFHCAALTLDGRAHPVLRSGPRVEHSSKWTPHRDSESLCWCLKLKGQT